MTAEQYLEDELDRVSDQLQLAEEVIETARVAADRYWEKTPPWIADLREALAIYDEATK